LLSPTGKCRVNLPVSVKRRRALLASNPSRNSRPELIADDEKGVNLPARSFTWARDRPTGGGTAPAPGFGLWFWTTSNRSILPCLKIRISRRLGINKQEWQQGIVANSPLTKESPGLPAGRAEGFPV